VGYCFMAIVREGISNALKHGNASRIRISVIEYPGIYQLVVHDNGSNAPVKSQMENRKPWNDSTARPAGVGIGLQTMDDRARALGGVFRTDYDRGFRIFVSVPKGSE
ncbi:MAG: ATP-binding protein, partial [Raoultibacter sp.]